MKPGPTGMNDLVVIQTVQGLIQHCKAEDKKCSVVIGYDHRANPTLTLSSKQFAVWSVLVFRQAGWDCLLLEGFVRTPLVPFLVHRTQATTLGIMVTASHNPKQDVGYRSDACQIRSPMDTHIAACIQANFVRSDFSICKAAGGDCIILNLSADDMVLSTGMRRF
jgi:phosphomannomutase